jgi:multiple sugar transport system permease protein
MAQETSHRETAGDSAYERAAPDFLDRLEEYIDPKWVLVLPAVLYAAILVVIPMIDLFALSFTGRSGFSLANYERMVTDSNFHAIIVNTFTFVVPATAIELVLGVALALAFYRDFPFKEQVQTLFLVPMVLSPFAVGMMFRWFFDSSLGIVNYLFGQVGLPRFVWLGDATLAMVSIIVADVWQWTPFVFLLAYATMKSIPESIIEAAKIDGASRWQRFRYIVVPHIYPVLLITALIKLIIAFKSSDKIFSMTNGGPGSATKTMTMYVYEITFEFGNFERGAAASVLFLVLILGIGNVFVWLLGRTSREV